MESQNLIKFLKESLRYRRNQEILLLTKYYLFSSIFDLPEKDATFFYKTPHVFSIVGLLHIDSKEIEENSIDINQKILQRQCVNDIFNIYIKNDLLNDLLSLYSNLNSNDFELSNKISELASKYNSNPLIIIKILKAEVDQLLRISKYVIEFDSLYKQFINNLDLIKQSGISNSNIKFFLSNFICKYLEVINPTYFYKLHTPITVTGIYGGIDTHRLKQKLDFFRSVIQSKDYISNKLDYFIKLNTTSSKDFKYLLENISWFNKKDLDFLINFSKFIYTKTPASDELEKLGFNTTVNSEQTYLMLNQLREKGMLEEEITQFFLLTSKYTLNLLDYFENFSFTFLNFIYENGPILSVLYLAYEGSLDMEYSTETKDSISKRIENKAHFITETISQYISNPLNFEIYNLNRLLSVLKVVQSLRSTLKTPNDIDGVILNTVNEAIRFNLIQLSDDELYKVLEIQESKIEDLLNIMTQLNNGIVNGYKSVISSIYNASNSYSLFQVARKAVADIDDIEVAMTMRVLIENLRKIGFNNTFLENNQHTFEFNKEVLIEYLNGGNAE